MDPHSPSCYVSSLERQIQSLHLILQEWAAYVPQDVVLKTRIPFVVHPQVPQLESSQNSLSSQRQKTLPPSPPEPEEAWRKSLISFIKKIPTAKNWSKAISPASLDTESLSSPSILQSLLKEPGQIGGGLSSVPVIQRQHTNILHTLESYALLTQKCTDSAKLAKLIASYQKFLFVALCHVACCVGIDENVVNKMMGSISNGNPEHLRQMRLAAAWGVAAVDTLQCKSKWGMRSGDILFYFTPSFYSLRNIAKGKQSIDVFTTSLCQSQYTEISSRLPKLHMNNLSVPCIIKCIFGKTVQLSDICKSLRADFNAARDIFTKWYSGPFGSNAFDDQELSSLFSPMITVSPRTQWGTGPSGGMIISAEDVRKRRRTDNGAGSPTTDKTPSDLVNQSTIDTPGPTISTDALTIADDDQISPRPCPSTYVNADFGDISQQSAREHPVLSAGTGLQLIDERQIGWPVPQAQHYSNHVPPLAARSPDTADVQALAYSVPSFNAISAIPFLPDSPFPAHSSPLPSSSLDYCIPSFSQITGIPSPV